MAYRRRIVVAGVLMLGGMAWPLMAADLTLPTGGRVVIELIGSEAAYRNTLSVTWPDIGVAIRGCGLRGPPASAA